MNFDKLQEQWNQENNEVSLPQNLDKIKEAHNPIDKVRRNMKFDLISQAVLTVLIGFVPYAKRNEWDFQSISIFALFYVLMVGFMLYYTLKFYRFYKQSYNLSYDSRKNLMWFAYELRLFIELYRALTFIMMFLGMALGLYFGIDFHLIKKAIEEYTPTNMRSQIVKKGDKTLVLDTYNANPSSMKVSLENFNDFIGTKTIIIGDMLELGEESVTEHSQILELAKSLSFDEIITVGPHFKEVNVSGVAFLTTQDLIHYLTENEIHSQNILLKASRGIALEKALEFIK